MDHACLPAFQCDHSVNGVKFPTCLLEVSRVGFESTLCYGPLLGLAPPERPVFSLHPGLHPGCHCGLGLYSAHWVLISSLPSEHCYPSRLWMCGPGLCATHGCRRSAGKPQPPRLVRAADSLSEDLLILMYIFI